LASIGNNRNPGEDQPSEEADQLERGREASWLRLSLIAHNSRNRLTLPSLVVLHDEAALTIATITA
jgi:hypothetical protein